jgi:riboflavin kinase/FMN adenylyltransferase
MRIVRNLSELCEATTRAVVTVGNFDGVHLAHQRLLRRVVKCARPLGAVATAVTFDPHPRQILAPEHAARLLTGLPQKIRLIEELGIDLIVVLPFTLELSQWTPADFIHRVLVEKLRPFSVHVGPSFRFGHRQAGNIQVLEGLARKEGFQVEVVPMLEIRGQPVSSTHIRNLLKSGQVGLARHLLGRLYSSAGLIVSGRGVGSRETVPTLNLSTVEELLPKVGVYVTRTRLDDRFHESVTNVGYRPTFDGSRLTVESYLLNFSGRITATEMEIHYLHRLRDEEKFPDAAALKKQIEHDAAQAKRFFRFLRHLESCRPRPMAADR